MSRRAWTRALWVVPVMHAACATPAAAEPGDACVTAYEQAQQLRRGGKLLRARAELNLCQRACPTMLTEDCDRWLGEVATEIPTVVLSATDADGKRLEAVRVLIDGSPLVDRIDARPVEVDPGEHTFRFVRGAASGIETKAALNARERAHPVGVAFPRDAVEAPAPSGPPTAAFILGGAGIAALGVGAFLGIKGQIDRSQLRHDGCAPHCSKGDVADIQTEWVVGGVAAGVGGAALAVAAWLWFSAPNPADARTRSATWRSQVGFGAACGPNANGSWPSISAGPLRGGGFARLAASF